MARQKNKGSRYSNYWFDNDYYNNYYASSSDKNDSVKGKFMDVMKLAAFKRSCANFVSILTGENIPVRYATDDSSYTDGKSVTLSGDVSPDTFDSTVGCALHEASHILLTDFKLWFSIFTDKKTFKKYVVTKHMHAARRIAGFSKAESAPVTFSGNKNVHGKIGQPWCKNRAEELLLSMFKDCLNWVEDRRIDNWVYTSAPGYRGYYDSLYDRYWLSDEIDKGIQSELYRDESVDSYMYRLINLHNEYTDLDALRGLKKISKIVDIKKISRLKNLEDSAQIASKILFIILKYAEKFSDNQNLQDMMSGGEGEGQSGNGGKFFELSDEDIKEMAKKYGMTEEELREILKKIQKQVEFINGETEKITISKELEDAVGTVQKSNTSVELSGGEEFGGQKVNVLVIGEINEGILSSAEYGDMFSKNNCYPDVERERSIEAGIVMGKRLGRKLQIRNEERSLKFTRQQHGKIDRTLIAGLGYDSVNVFSRLEIDKFSSSHLHISVDASGSMHGEPFNKALKTTAAIVQACSMVKNLECVVSFRTTMNAGSTHTPTVFIAYDSRKNSPIHFRKYAKYFNSNGATPESLCFEAMMEKVIPIGNRNKQVLFLNISDGSPYWYGNADGLMDRSGGAGAGYVSYQGDSARRHCRRMVSILERKHNCTVIGYLIGCEEDFTEFTEMYGTKNSFNIDTDGIEQIARSLNKKFLESSNKMVENG